MMMCRYFFTFYYSSCNIVIENNPSALGYLIKQEDALRFERYPKREGTKTVSNATNFI